MYNYTNWGDQLMAYDGKRITYDAIGNPLTYDGWTFTWEHGRELMAMTDGTTTWSYTYNADGLRTGKTNGTLSYSYFYDGGRLYYMTRGTDQLWFAYDDSVPMFVKYNATTYLYLTNLQGDVIAILDNTGAKVVEYAYDAWGNLLSITGSMASTLGVINPLTYRGYVYDHETGLYYLQSRYYNPTWGRFLNADSFVSTGQGQLGSNMFAYCRNNPIFRKDASGTADYIAYDECPLDEEDLLDIGRGGGGGSGSTGGFWGTLMGTMDSLAQGLNMAVGSREGIQTHHYLSPKSQKYTPKYRAITDKYGLNLEHEWNKQRIEQHCGRHTNEYHEFMLEVTRNIDEIADGSAELFLEGFQILVDFVNDNLWILYAK